MEHFSPTVLVDGYTVTPEGWMYVLAFALRGVPWAVKVATDPQFDLRGKIDDYNRREKKHYLELDLAHYDKRLAEVKAELKGLIK